MNVDHGGRSPARVAVLVVVGPSLEKNPTLRIVTPVNGMTGALHGGESQLDLQTSAGTGRADAGTFRRRRALPAYNVYGNRQRAPATSEGARVADAAVAQKLVQQPGCYTPADPGPNNELTIKPGRV